MVLANDKFTIVVISVARMLKHSLTNWVWTRSRQHAAEPLGINRLFEYEIPELEAMWVKVKAGNTVFLLCVYAIDLQIVVLIFGPNYRIV